MHPREIARRASEANARITAAATAIGEHLGIDAPDFTTISNQGGVEVKRLRERELQAAHLEAIAEALESGGEHHPSQPSRKTAKKGRATSKHETEQELTVAPDSEIPGTARTRPDDALAGEQITDGQSVDELPPPVVDSES